MPTAICESPTNGPYRKIPLSTCTPVWLDFETYYSSAEKYGLRQLTNEAYIRDPRFETLMVSIKVGVHGVTQVHVGGVSELLPILSAMPWDKVACFSHNASFDMSILCWRFGITPAYTLCTMGMWKALMGVRYRSSLKVIAETLGLQQKGDTVASMDGKHLHDLTPAELNAYVAYCGDDTDICFQITRVLLPYLTEPELHNCHAAIQMYTQARLVLDKAVLADALAAEKLRRATLFTTCREHLGMHTYTDAYLRGILGSNDKFKALLEALGVTVALKKTKRKVKGMEEKQTFMIPAFAKTDEGMVALLESDDVVIADLSEARLMAKSTQMVSRTERFIGIAERGSLPTPIQYAGAAVTQRYGAGMDKINLQNLKNGSRLRDAVTAGDGYKIVGGDLSQIELRFGWLLAGEYEKLQRFASGHDPYKQLITETFGIEYEGMDKLWRTVGKVVNLSAIFGTGWASIQDTVRLRAKKIISEGAAKQLVGTYREGHPSVKRAWSQGTDVLEALILGKEIRVWHDGWGHVVPKDPNNLFDAHGAVYRPSGLRLQYPHLKKQRGQWPDGRPKDEYTYMRQRDRGGAPTVEYMYGAKMYQNFVQAGSRDVIANIISDIVETIPEHWFLVGQVHDELWLHVPDEETEEAALWLENKMVTVPPWCPTLPLACETYVAANYGAGK